MSPMLTIWLPLAAVVVGAVALVVVPPLGWAYIALALAAVATRGRHER